MMDIVGELNTIIEIATPLMFVGCLFLMGMIAGIVLHVRRFNCNCRDKYLARKVRK